jgi:NRAMP (natural resistance-associated macrophage protein)-like metal ion transporter
MPPAKRSIGGAGGYRGRLGLLGHLGPGLVTGASDDDPSGIGTYSQVGAQFRFTMLWTAPAALPLAAAVEELAGRIGLCSGRGLAAEIKQHLPRPFIYMAAALVIAANIFNVGADLGSMAAALHLLVPIPAAAMVVGVGVLILLLEVLIPYRQYSKVLRLTTLALLAYIGVLVVVKVDWGAVLNELVVPHLTWDKAYLGGLIAIFGTTISPYLMFWQASEEVEENEGPDPHRRPTTQQVRGMRLDVITGMAAAVIVMFAIIVATSTTLGAKGITDINSAEDAAEALRPIAGSFASLLFTLGIVGTGSLAVPVLAGSTGYALAETLSWNEGLSKSVRDARGFYAIIAVAMLVGIGLNFIGINPIKALVYAAVLNGLAAPPLMVMMMVVGNKKEALGTHRSGWLSNALVGVSILVMAGLPVAYLLVR